MASFLFDLDDDFKDLSKSVKTLTGGMADLDKSFNKANKTGLDLGKSMAQNTKIFQQFGSSTGRVLLGVVGGLASILEITGKLSALKTIGDAASDSWKKFKKVEESLTFSTAITGSSQLADNFKTLEKVSGKTLKTIELGLQATFNTSEFNKWSSSAVSAYAQVEQAAYKFATVTTSTNERSINKIQQSIKATRELQKATNDAASTVELLNTQYDIASAGFTSKKDNLNVGKASVNLSQAGFGDVAGSTNALVRTLRALGDESSAAEKRAAQLFETTRVGLLSLNQLIPEVGTLAVLSKNLGIEFSEVSAALAGLTTQGISASEGTTRLQAFFSEVVSGSQEANQYLSKFRDEAGKPIQLNATALREKGIGGIIADLKRATNGSQSALQQIFGRQESVEAVQLLSNLGTPTLKTYQQGIEGASGSRLDEEAKNRQKTVIGAFNQAANKSQKQIEDFGQGLAPNVLESLASTNEVIDKLLTTSAEGVGNLTGSLSGLATQVKAVGGFILTAFSVVAPFALFTAAVKGFQILSQRFKQLQKEGETPWQSIERLAYSFIAKAEDRLLKFIQRVKQGIADVKNELNDTVQDSATKQLAGTKEMLALPGSASPEFSPNPQRQLGDGSKARGTVEVLSSDSDDKRASQARRIFLVEEKQSNLEKVAASTKARNNLVEGATRVRQSLQSAAKDAKDKLESAAIKTRQTLSNITTGIRNRGSSLARGDIGGALAIPGIESATKGVSGFGAKLGGVVQGGLKVAAPILGSIGKYMAGLALGGVAAGTALSVLSGWGSTLFQTLNSKTIPAVQELRDSLSDLKDVKGLDAFLASIDPVAASAQNTSFAMSVLNETLQRGKGLWSDLTGASFNYFNNIEPLAAEADKILKESIETRLASFSKTSFGAVSDAGKTAQNKLDKGIALNQDDFKAIEDEFSNSTKQIDARISLKRKDIKDLQDLGKIDQVEIAQKELKVLELQSKEQKNQLDLKLKQIKLDEAQNRLESIDTTLPLQLQLSSQNEDSIRRQIESIMEGLIPEKALNDPAVYDRLGSNIRNALASIETQLEIDPSSTAKLRSELRSTVKDFDKLLFTDPQLRQKASELNQKITDSTIKQSQTQESADTSVFSQAQSLGSQSSAVAQAKFEAQTRSLNAQVKVLNEELSRPETTLTRQKEILAQIEQLEAQRSQNSADNRIAQELGSRKQTLTLSEQLLDVEKARINLFNQESRFGSLAVTAAEARLQAAQKELQVKKEQLSISSREEIIRKEEAQSSLAAKVNRDKAELNRVTGGRSNDELKQLAEANKNQIDTKAKQEIDALKADTERKLKELKTNPIKLSKEEVAKLKSAGVGDLVDAEGNVTGDITKAQNFLATKADNFARLANDKTGNIQGLKNVNPVSYLGDAVTASYSFDQSQKAREAASLLNEKQVQQKISANKVSTEAQAQEKSLKDRQDNDKKAADALLKSQLERANELRSNQGAANALGVATSAASNSTSGLATTTQDDLEFSKLLGLLKEQFGSLNEQIAISEAVIAKEFAGREKLIKRGELLGETLGEIAQSGSIFGNSVAGAALGLEALKLSNKPGRLDKEADEEIAKINSKIETLAKNASTAEQIASAAREKGVKPQTQAQLDEQASKARQLANKAQSEAPSDIAFVRQKTALDKLAATLEASEAKINLEFKSREKLVERTNSLADSFGALASSAVVANSLAGATLQRVQAELKDRAMNSNNEDEKLIAQVNERIKTLENLAKQGGEVGAAAQRQLPKAREEAAAEIRFIKTDAALAVISTNLELSAAKVKEELSVRTRLIEMSESLGGAFGSLASTASSLFQNSSLGATLNRFSSELNAGTGKARKEYDEQIKLLNTRNQALRDAVTQAEQSGADKDTVARLREAASREETQRPVEEAYLRQKVVLETLNERLSVMSAAVSETVDALNKSASLSKDQIDFEQRRTNLTAESNSAGRGLQSALIGAFAKNNPFAEVLQKRIDFTQAAEEGNFRKSQNTTEAKKELIDTQLQKQQLILEQQSYENAITQTQLLSDLVSIQQGGQASFSNTEDVKNRLGQLPALIESSRQTAAERLGFVEQKLQYIPQELEQRNRNVDMGTRTRQLGIVSQNGILDPSMLPQIREVLAASTQDLSRFRPERIDPGSLGDARFQSDLAKLNRYSQNQTGAVVPSIQAPVNINLTVSGSDAQAIANDVNNMKQYITTQIQGALGQLGKQLVTASKRV